LHANVLVFSDYRITPRQLFRPEAALLLPCPKTATSSGQKTVGLRPLLVICPATLLLDYFRRRPFAACGFCYQRIDAGRQVYLYTKRERRKNRRLYFLFRKLLRIFAA